MENARHLIAQMAIVLITAIRLAREIRATAGEQGRNTETRLLTVELLLAVATLL
jgi:hypothetical protein